MAKKRISEEAQARLEMFLKRVDLAVDGVKDPYINGGRQGSTGGVRSPDTKYARGRSYNPKSGC